MCIYTCADRLRGIHQKNIITCIKHQACTHVNMCFPGSISSTHTFRYIFMKVFLRMSTPCAPERLLLLLTMPVFCLFCLELKRSWMSFVDLGLVTLPGTPVGHIPPNGKAGESSIFGRHLLFLSSPCKWKMYENGSLETKLVFHGPIFHWTMIIWEEDYSLSHLWRKLWNMVVCISKVTTIYH